MKEKIINKLDELTKAKQNYIAQLNAINGAIQVIEELLKEEESQREIEVK